MVIKHKDKVIMLFTDDMLTEISRTLAEVYIHWEKVEFIGNHRRVTMVDTACENNYERIDSDSDTIQNIVESYGDCSFSFRSESWVLPSKNDNWSRINWTEIFLIVGVSPLIVFQKL